MHSPFWGGVAEGRLRVLVTGVGGNVAQGVFKALSACRLASWVVGTDANPMSMGLWAVDCGYVVPKADAADYTKRFKEIILEQEVALVFVGADEETVHLAHLKQGIEKDTGAFVLVSPEKVVRRCHDKWATAKWLAELGVSHPDTVRADDEVGRNRLAEELGFPSILKPRSGFASRNVVEVIDRSSLENAARILGDRGVVQAKVGSDDQEFTAATFSSRSGQVEAVMVMHRELLQGTSYRVEPVFDDNLKETVRSWAVKVGGIGPMNFQFRLEKGEPVCFEINARFSGTVGVRWRLGYNDVEMALRSFGLGQEVCQPRINPGVVLRYWDEFVAPGESMQSLSAKSSFKASKERC